MQGGWQPPPGGGGYGGPPGGGGYGGPPGGGGYGGPPGGGGYGPPPGDHPAGPGGAPGYAGSPPGQGFAQNPYGAPSGGAGMTPQYGNYEFNEYENSILEKTASRAKLWGIISTVLGAFQIIGSCGMVANPALATYFPAGIVAVVIGLTFIGAGNSLKAVVSTQGNDLMHLMQAMQKLSTAFIVEIVCAIVGFVLAVIGIVLVLFVFVAAAATSQ